MDSGVLPGFGQKAPAGEAVQFQAGGAVAVLRSDEKNAVGRGGVNSENGGQGGGADNLGHNTGCPVAWDEEHVARNAGRDSEPCRR